MPTLALAGGTSASLGRAIVSALLSSPIHRPWNAIILSRNSSVPLWLRAVDPHRERTRICAVDYSSTESLKTALDGVHTVVSVTSAVDGTQAQVQKNLLHAAVQAGCKRFAPAQWGLGSKGYDNLESTKWSNEGVWDECLKYKEKIESAKFNQGFFMNYIGHGIYPIPSNVDDQTLLQRMKEGGGYAAGEDEACQGLLRQGDLKDGSGAVFIGLKKAIAELPIKDDGTWPRITMTAIRDVGRFVVASLNLPRWEENMDMSGDTITMGELLAHAEAIIGKKVQVDMVTKTDIEKKLANIAQDDFMSLFWTELKLAYIRDLDDEVVLEPVVNRLCPSVRPMGVQEYMKTYWTGA